MKEDLTYSFIIPHKNAPHLLKRCVASIPRRDDVQIIVIDDDSDPTIVDWKSFKFQDERCIEVIHSKGCKSAGAVRNEGLKRAKGKWLLFADCDDYYNPGLLDVLDEYKDSDIEVLYYNVDCVDGETGESSNVYQGYQKQISNYKNNKSLLDNIRYAKPPWTKMVKRDFIASYHIQFEDVILGNDVWYSYQVGYFAKKVEVLDKQLYVYTINSNSISFHRTVAKDVVQIETYVKQNAFFDFIGHPEWHHNLPGWIKYHWLKSNHKFKYTIALIANARRIYKVRNKYVEGIRQSEIAVQSPTGVQESSMC